MEHLESSKDAGASATTHGLNQNTVAVVVVQHQDIVVAGAGRDNKFASLVGVNLTSGGFDNQCQTVMGMMVARVAAGKVGGKSSQDPR
jgi:hypothetical protein